MSSLTVCSSIFEWNQYKISENVCTWKWLKSHFRWCLYLDGKSTFGVELVNWVTLCTSSSPLSSCLSPPSEHFYNQQMPYRGLLPLKHTPLTSSIGSVTTLTTVADEEGADEEAEELGRVAGWVTSFDRLLADPLGVQCLLVSVCGCTYMCVCMCVCWCVHVCLHLWMHSFVC